MNFSSDGKQENVNINNNIQQQINEFPTEREAVEFVCSVLTLNGVRDINPEVFRRGSLGREEVCAKIWKALHDLIFIGHSLSVEEDDHSRDSTFVADAWTKLIKEGGREAFSFSDVMATVVYTLRKAGYGRSHKVEEGSRELCLAILWVCGRFRILEHHLRDLRRKSLSTLPIMWNDADAFASRTASFGDLSSINCRTATARIELEAGRLINSRRRIQRAKQERGHRVAQ